MATTTSIDYVSDQAHIKECLNCGLRYDWRRSPSTSLKMTYCGSLCEQSNLGFTIDALLRVERAPREQEMAAEPAPAMLLAA